MNMNSQGGDDVDALSRADAHFPAYRHAHAHFTAGGAANSKRAPTFRNRLRPPHIVRLLGRLLGCATPEPRFLRQAGRALLGYFHNIGDGAAARRKCSSRRRLHAASGGQELGALDFGGRGIGGGKPGGVDRRVIAAMISTLIYHPPRWASRLGRYFATKHSSKVLDSSAPTTS